MAKLRIYLPETPNKGTYEIYREGKHTGELVKRPLIRKILTNEQYKEFLSGENDIFLVEGETFRTRNHKEKLKKYTGKNINLI